jgi:protein involved in polysaccharide export with SLBB domain
MLVAAGGILYDADVEHIHITNEETQQCIEVSLIDLLQKQDNMQDVHLIPGDTIVVPKLASPILVDENKYKLYASSTFSPSTIPVKVVGYVNAPGLINLEPAQSRNLLSAIASAGGYLRESAYFPKEVLVLRHSDQDGKLHRFEVNPRKNDMALFPNDIVYVPLKRIPRAGLFFDFINRMVTPFGRFANGYENFTGDAFVEDLFDGQ